MRGRPPPAEPEEHQATAQPARTPRERRVMPGEQHTRDKFQPERIRQKRNPRDRRQRRHRQHAQHQARHDQRVRPALADGQQPHDAEIKQQLIRQRPTEVERGHHIPGPFAPRKKQKGLGELRPRERITRRRPPRIHHRAPKPVERHDAPQPPRQKFPDPGRPGTQERAARDDKSAQHKKQIHAGRPDRLQAGPPFRRHPRRRRPVQRMRRGDHRRRQRPQNLHRLQLACPGCRR